MLSWQPLCVVLRALTPVEAPVTTRNYDDTIDRWRLEPRFNTFELEDPPDVGQPPTLWKDLTMASVVALVLWVTAALVFG
jgi:hypothetical protein